jgi:hypothetical protein
MVFKIWRGIGYKDIILALFVNKAVSHPARALQFVVILPRGPIFAKNASLRVENIIFKEIYEIGADVLKNALKVLYCGCYIPDSASQLDFPLDFK